MQSSRKMIKHISMDQFKSECGELLVNGIALTQLKMRAGQTPFYAYDRSIIESKIEYFRQSMPANLKLNYAIKANPMTALVEFISNKVDGLDVASGKELQKALNSKMNHKHISFAGPAKSERELAMAIASGITVNIESFRELERIKTICNETSLVANVAIRVNPDFELKSSGMKMGGGPQQFGIDAEQVPNMFNRIEEMGLNYRGLHIFTGSQNLNADSIILAHQNIFELAAKLQQKTSMKIHSLNIGGGLGIPYFPGEKPLELNKIGVALKTLIANFKKRHGEVEISMELGRFLVGESGIYVAEVVDLKTSRETSFVVVDGGLNHHLSVTGNFGQVIRKNYPVAFGNKINAARSEKQQVVGPLCTPLDILASHYQLPKAEIGDLFVVFQSGAYGFSASPRDFLSHPHPVEMLV